MLLFPRIDCPLDRCAGRILREPILADRPFPPFNRAMMDGYALRLADLAQGNSFRIEAKAMAGEPLSALACDLGSCVEIMTGAVVPEGADCVVPYEETERLEDGTIRLSSPTKVKVGDAIHRLGSDYTKGKPLIQPGRLIGGREIAIAATCGYAKLKVTKLPSIAIICTGDELVEVSTQPESYQIRRSNDLSAETTLSRAGFSAKERIHLKDEASNLSKTLLKVIEENDVVIISGGISMGKLDLIPGVLTGIGLTCHFHGVAQKPGKPFGFWSRPKSAVFALPGNPISTLTCLHHYVLPALHEASGGDPLKPRFAQLAGTAVGHPCLTVLLPVALDANNRATPRPTNNSGDLVSILDSDGYIELPPATEPFDPQRAFPYTPWI